MGLVEHNLSIFNSKKPSLGSLDFNKNDQNSNCPQNEKEWCIEDKELSEMINQKDYIYVNLAENRESYTAYEGSQVWNLIYQENCNFEEYEDLAKETCDEETFLYQVMSGLHTSINTHISNAFFEDETSTSNMTYFFSRVGDHKERIKNLYLVYSAVTKAVTLAESTLLQ